VPPLHVQIFIFEKYLNLYFWWNFKVSALGRFWQFWADFAALTVADNKPQLGLKS
jgi:hypothetical protein